MKILHSLKSILSFSHLLILFLHTSEFEVVLEDDCGYEDLRQRMKHFDLPFWT